MTCLHRYPAVFPVSMAPFSPCTQGRRLFGHHAHPWQCPNLRPSTNGHRRGKLGAKVEQKKSRPPVLMFATLPNDVITLSNQLAYPKALKVALLALKSIGMDAVVVEVWWGLVEGRGPHCYTWEAYEAIFDMLHAVGLKVRVHLCFHGNGVISLPAWVLEVGTQNPDIFFSDRQHDHSLDCLSIGIDEVPVLRGRTGLQCYFDLMHSFHHRFKHLYNRSDGLIQEMAIGMGPHGELRYPSFRSEKWEFPGIGEFQCYDEYMLSMLHAAALQTGHAEYGHGGPHDAGSYCQWPQQTKFFRDSGSWSLEYGEFFLDWYSNQLLHHANALLQVAHKVFRDSPVQLQVKLPAIHWWHHTQSHAAELTAGINHTSMHEGYLPIMDALARWECDVLISACEKLTSQQPGRASCDPEALISHVHTCASVVDIQIGLETSEARFDETAFSRIEEHLAGTDRNRAMQLNPIKSFTFNRMGSLMFEPSNWHRYKAFINRLTQRLNKEE